MKARKTHFKAVLPNGAETFIPTRSGREGIASWLYANDLEEAKLIEDSSGRYLNENISIYDYD